MKEKKEILEKTIALRITPEMLAKLPKKKGQFIREAIQEKLDREK